MQAGKLDKDVRIMRVVLRRDERFGQQVEEWIEHKVVRGSVIFKGGTQLVSKNELMHTERNEVWIRLDRSVDRSMRLEIEGERYRVLSVDHDRRGGKTVLQVALLID